MEPFDDGSEEEAERTRVDAGRIVDGMFGSRGLDVVEDEVLVLSDVDEDVSRYTEQLQLLDYLGLPAPVVRVAGDSDDFIPLALGLVGLPAGPFGTVAAAWWYDSDRNISGVLNVGYDQARSDIEGFTTVPVQAARSKFRDLLTGFVGVRLAAVRNHQRSRSAWPNVSSLRLARRSGKPSTVTPGCSFVVSTNSAGLRVHWSGAYWLSPNYFSAPTSPATSTLQSGAYRFGVDGGAYRRITWDQTVVTLPGSPTLHLNF